MWNNIISKVSDARNPKAIFSRHRGHKEGTMKDKKNEAFVAEVKDVIVGVCLTGNDDQRSWL